MRHWPDNTTSPGIDADYCHMNPDISSLCGYILQWFTYTEPPNLLKEVRMNTKKYLLYVTILLASFGWGMDFSIAAELYIPHVAPPNAYWRTILQVNNPGSVATGYSLTLFNQGNPVYSETQEVPAASYRAIDLKTLSPLATTGTIDTDSSDLQFNIAYEHMTGGGLAEFELSGNSNRQLGFYFANFSPGITWKGIALMNSGSGSESVDLYALGDGYVIGNVSVVVPAMGRIVGTHAKWFPDITVSQIIGIMAMAGSDTLTGISISGTQESSRLLSSLARPADNFSPDNPEPPPLPVGSEYVVLAWNDLGMHCLNPTYDKAVILPPYNTIWAQVIKRGNPPEVITQGLSVEYRMVNNTFSYGKRDYGQFWDYDQDLFGIDLAVDTGLNLKHPTIHNTLSGAMISEGDHFEAVGIPVTPVRDNLLYDPYQQAEITVKNQAGTILAQTRATVPVSDEINCAHCHGPDPFQDVLEKHPPVNGESLTTRVPVLCASCHGSPALGSAAGERGSAGSYLSEAIHGFHADRGATCYMCHPGQSAKCNRSEAHTAPDGNCIACHGTLAQMAEQISTNGRVPWVDEPKCVNCHNVSGVDTGNVLYRDAAGHGGVYCTGCHQSPHAQIPSLLASDNYQAIQYQGMAVPLGSCEACHETSRGPQGEDDDFSEHHAGTNPEDTNACHICHTAVNGNTGAWPHAFNWKAR